MDKSMDYKQGFFDGYRQAMEQANMCIYNIKAEIKSIQEAEMQVYGKGSWNFIGKCLDIIDKHTRKEQSE